MYLFLKFLTFLRSIKSEFFKKKGNNFAPSPGTIDPEKYQKNRCFPAVKSQFLIPKKVLVKNVFQIVSRINRPENHFFMIYPRSSSISEI